MSLVAGRAEGHVSLRRACKGQVPGRLSGHRFQTTCSSYLAQLLYLNNMSIQEKADQIINLQRSIFDQINQLIEMRTEDVLKWADEKMHQEEYSEQEVPEVDKAFSIIGFPENLEYFVRHLSP